MACVKSVSRSASVALSPDSPYLAAGTMAGAVDMSFSSSAFLEIFKLDFQSDDKELALLGQSTSSERFNRLSWGKNGSTSEEFNLGLIAGGLQDGSIGLWNPLAMIRSESSSNPLVGQLSRHKGPVHGLEFNSVTPHMLASGADDGEICIWDLAKPTEPSHFPPLRGSGSAAQGQISYLSWNNKVQHILASASCSGTVVVWDLKRQKPVLSLQDSNRRRCSVLQWNPDLATQLVIASDDDNSSSLKLWDMRNTMSPVKEFVGHTKGVISMSWCPIDSTYLLTCAKDNRTICWDTLSGEIVCELPAGTNWNFDIHWYPKIPGVVSASSFDGKIGLYNIEACSRYGVAETDFSTVPLRAPKWYKRPAGVCFGFGGKLVSFCSSSTADAQGEAGGSEVYLHNVVIEDSLVSRSTEFQAVIQNGEMASLRAVCARKEQESELEDDKETWGFLKVMFEDDGTARTKLITHLGFSLPDVEKEDDNDHVLQQVDALAIQENIAEKEGYTGNGDSAAFSLDNGEDFFNNLPSPKADTSVSSSTNHFAVKETVIAEDSVQVECDDVQESLDPEFDDAVQRALVVGDYKGAIAKCISANRMADALVISHVGGPTLWESTRDQYLKKSNLPYLKVVSAMMNNDLIALIHTRPVNSWKGDACSSLHKFAQGEEWTSLCDTLALKLMASGNTLAATLCYMCAGNIDRTVEIWSLGLSGDFVEKTYADRLQDLMEKAIVFALATGQKRFSPAFCKLVEKYAEILASQGLLSTAMDYLKLLGEDLSPELLILKDRIALSTESVIDASIAHTGAVDMDNQPTYLMAEDSQCRYQDMSQPQFPPAQTVLTSSYSENYQQYQLAPKQPMLLPFQAPPGSQENFAPPLAASQPVVKPFVPASPPVLKNVDQYQQPPTLASHLYHGQGNASYQPGSSVISSSGPMAPPTLHTPGQSNPSFVPTLPAPVVHGIVPVPSPGVGAVRPGTSSMQPSIHAYPATVQPAVTTATAPPPTVQTADTSRVPAEQKRIVVTLTRLFHGTVAQAGGAPARKKEMEDNSRRIGMLFDNLNKGQISNNVIQKLLQLCDYLDKGDYHSAMQCQVQLTTSDWDECQYWLAALKRMIRMSHKA